MNILNKVALEGMKKNPTRTLVTIIGVILSAAMITSVTTFGISMLTYVTNGAIAKYGGWHVAFSDVDSYFAEEQDSDSRVIDTSEFENIGYAELDDVKDHTRPYIFLAGFDDKAFETAPLTIFSGRLPQNSDEIIVSGRLQTNGGINIAIGDKISLNVGERIQDNRKLNQNDKYISGNETFIPKSEKNYTIVGICQTPVFEEEGAPGYTAITRIDTIDTSDNCGMFVTLKNPHEIHDYINSLGENHGYVLNDNVLRFMGLSDDTIFNAVLYTVGGIVIIIIMIGSVFLIYNSFSISLNERTHQFGILSSVGATAKQLRNSVIFEGLCIGAVGIPIGVVAGICGIGIVISVVAKSFGNVIYDNVPLKLTISISAIIMAAAVSFVTILISAYIPARKAANTPVMECIRQTNEVKVEGKSVKISKLTQCILGLEGMLALKNFKRNRKQYGSIVLSLALSVVLFISVSSFVTYLKQGSERVAIVSDYDIGFGTIDMEDNEMLLLYDKFKNVSNVYESMYMSVLNYSCIVSTSDLSDDYKKLSGVQPQDKTIDLPVIVELIDDENYMAIINKLGLPEKEYMRSNAKLISVAKIEDNKKRLEEVDQIGNLFKNSSIELNINPVINGEVKTEYGQNLNVDFVNIVPPDMPIALEAASDKDDNKSSSIIVMAPYSLREKFEIADAPVDMKVKGCTFKSKNPSQSISEMRGIVQDGKFTGYSLIDNTQMLAESRNYIFIANVFAYTFLFMISLIAVANVFNTISTNIKMRRRELAMLRSVGMSDHEFQKMMNFECGFYGMKALLLGIPIALIISLLIFNGMIYGGLDDINFIMPWASIGISVFGVLFIVFITMLYTISKIKKENIIDALRDDLT